MADEKKINLEDPALKASPEEVEEMKKGRGLGILRMNGLAYGIAGLILFLFVLVWAISTMNRHNQANAPEETKAVEVDKSGTDFAQEVLGKATKQDAGIMQALPKEDFEPKGEGLSFGTKKVAEEEAPKPNRPFSNFFGGNDREDPPMPTEQTRPIADSEDEMRARAEKRQLIQDRYHVFSQAVNSATGVAMNGAGGGGSLSGGRYGSASADMGGYGGGLGGGMDEQLAQMKSDAQAKIDEVRGKLAAMSLDGDMGGAYDPAAGVGRTTSLGNRAPNAKQWELASQPQAPKPYEVSTGFVIPATMITGINSDLPGSIQAQVSRNVYDTATGKYLLIPQGTKLIGYYNNNIAFGQSRVLVAWNRLIFPDGRKLDIGEMHGATGAGYSGFEDKVNNHYFRLFGSAFLMSAITAGVTWSQDRNDSNNNSSTSASEALSEALGQQLGQVTAQLIAKHLNVAPTIEIRPGFRFNIVVTKDITFKRPYKNFDY